MRNLRRSKKGQFSVISALLVSVILIMAVISMYSMVRYTSLNDSPKVLTGIGEMNNDIKRILDFTVGYYGSILRVTGNSTYAKQLTTSYLSSGLVNIARSHPEWNPSFELDFEQVSTCWFMPNSYSMGNLSITYSLSALGLEGITYETSSALSVEMLDSASPYEAKISVTRDNSEPELGLTKNNFWFYNYSYSDSTWVLVNPTNVLIASNGVYTITLPDGINPDSYSVQIEDNRGIIVPAFYSHASVVDLGIPHYTYTFDWNSTGMIDIYSSLDTDNFVIELLQNGTLKWLGQSLEQISDERPIPPVSVKAFRVNATINGNNQEVPFQVEDWASNYKVPLGLSGNDSIFSNTNMLVFLVNDHVSEITLWWDGNDTAIQTPYAWENRYFNDDPDYSPFYGLLSNGILELRINNFWIESTVEGTLTSCRADFMRVNYPDGTPQYGDQLAYVIYNGVIRDIVQQEPEYGGGIAGCPNFYSQVILTFPANATYYTYSARAIFLDSTQTRNVDDLSVIQLSDFHGDALTEDGTTVDGYPDSSSYVGYFYGDFPSSEVHHWSQLSSGNSGVGLMFTDKAQDGLYVFDSITGSNTGALFVDDGWDDETIEFNPVEEVLTSVYGYTDSLDVLWCGAVVTFDGESIYRSSDDVGLWVMVEHPPVVSMDEPEEEEEPPTSPPESSLEFYVDNDTSDVDSSPDKGSHSDFSAQQDGPDSTVDVLTETTEGHSGVEDYVDNNTSDVDTSEDVGSHSDFSAQQAGPDSVFDTLTEENTAGSGGSTLLDDGFEAWDWDANWDDTFHSWIRSSTRHGESYSAGASNYNEGVFTSDSLDASDASAIYVDFWFRKVYTGSTDFTLYYYDGSNYDMVDELDDNGGDYNWLHFTATITDSQYFVPNFRIQFDATLDWGENVWVDDVVITKEVSTGDNYELDLEVQFTDIVNLLPDNELCIYAGSLGSEDLNVDYWNGYAWENVATDLTANSWNNFTVTVTSTTFTVKFSGGNDAGDASADQWQIDTVLLNNHGSVSIEEAVDNDASDLDSSSGLGTITNFDNMKTADSTYTTLSESGSGGGITFVSVAEASTTYYYETPSVQINKPAGTQQNDFMIALLVSTKSSGDGCTMSNFPSGWTLQHDYTQSASSGQHVYIYWKIADVSEPSSYEWTWAQSCGWVAQISTFRGVDINSPILVEGTVNQEYSSSPTSPSITTTEDNCMIWLYDMCDDDDIPGSGGAPSGTSWIDQTEISSSGNGVGISTARYIQTSAGATGNKDWSLDYYTTEENSAQQFALKPASTDYRLDQEVQWIDVPCTLPNEYLSIYGGNMGAENIAVDVWTGIGWETIFTDLSSGWNNASITQWLTDSTFTIRFRDGTEVGDTSPDTWQIAVALIHVWNEGEENYELDLEVQWTNVDYDEDNEELCIYVGEVAAENLRVDVWTGSAWETVISSLNVGWNNVTVSSYLTSSTFTIRFVGETETGDTIQDYWTIDATLLRGWT